MWHYFVPKFMIMMKEIKFISTHFFANLLQTYYFQILFVLLVVIVGKMPNASGVLIYMESWKRQEVQTTLNCSIHILIVLENIFAVLKNKKFAVVVHSKLRLMNLNFLRQQQLLHSHQQKWTVSIFDKN